MPRPASRRVWSVRPGWVAEVVEPAELGCSSWLDALPRGAGPARRRATVLWLRSPLAFPSFRSLSALQTRRLLGEERASVSERATTVAPLSLAPNKHENDLPGARTRGSQVRPFLTNAARALLGERLHADPVVAVARAHAPGDCVRVTARNGAARRRPGWLHPVVGAADITVPAPPAGVVHRAVAARLVGAPAAGNLADAARLVMLRAQPVPDRPRLTALDLARLVGQSLPPQPRLGSSFSSRHESTVGAAAQRARCSPISTASRFNAPPSVACGGGSSSRSARGR